MAAMQISSAQFEVSSSKRTEFIDITERVERAIRHAQATQGVVHIFVPHTTAAIAINENADPAVARDIMARLEWMAPPQANYAHTEGNADAHIKATLIGSSVNVLIEDARLQLGQWQGIFFCEFDGPRRRTVWLKIIGE